MHAGALRERIALQNATATQDEYGAQIRTWTTYAAVYASVLPNRRATDLEAFVAATGQERQRNQYTITIYFRDDVIVTDRITWGNKVLDIEQVYDPDGQRHWLELKCQEATDAGY